MHPVAFHSRKFQLAEINYEIHDKELLAVVDAFKLEALLRRSRPPDTSTLGSPKSGILYDDQGSTQPTAGVVGTRAGRNQLPNLLLSRITEWKAGCVIKAFGISPRKGEGRKPSGNDGFTGETPHRRTNPIIRHFISKTRIPPNKKLEWRVSTES